MNWGRIGLIGGGSLLGLFVAVEIALRVFGVLDFPLWRADPVLGYIPAPNQHGKLFNTADWVFNEHSMGVAAPFKATPGCVMLVGDSLVYSGAKTPQREKLGPLLEHRIGRAVWPIAANSWALKNELTYLNAHPEVLACSTVVIVSNTGDYQDPSVWKSELTHPRRRPLIGSLYLLEKGLFSPAPPPFAWPSAAQKAQWGGSLDRFLAGYKGRVIFALYPDKREMTSGEDKFGPFRSYLRGRAEILEVRPHWSVSAYKDSIHPKREWEPRLADLLAAQIQSRHAP